MMIAQKTKYRRVIGVDVASDKLDINDSQTQTETTISNSVAAIRAKLLKKIDDNAKTLVVCEASGGY